MFLKKSLLFTTILALLMFAGQVSAQSVSFTHVPGEGGTAGMVSGQGTTITVEISQMGVTASVNAIEIMFEFDQSLLTLSAPAGYILTNGNTLSLLSITPVQLPESSSFTFTTTADVTDVEFSIGLTGISLNNTPLPASGMIAFNAGSGGMPPDDLSVSLTSGGQSEVNKVGPSQDIEVTVSVSGMTGETVGVEFNIDSDKVTVKSVAPASGLLQVTGTKDVTLVGLPTTLADGFYGTVTLTTAADVATDMAFSINVADLVVFQADGMKKSVAAGMPLMVNQYAPYLEASATEVTVPHGETAMVTVTVMDAGDEEVMFTVDADGVEYSMEGGTVTLSATGNGTATVSAMAGGVATNSVTVVFMKPPPMLMTESTEVVFDDFGAMASATVTAVGFDEGAVIQFSYEATADFQAMEDGSSLTIMTGAPGDVTVTATDGTASASLTITFMNPPPYLEADNSDVIIPTGGEVTVTVTATGLEGEITYVISKTSGTAMVDAVTEGSMVTLTASGEGSAMVSVTGSDAMMTTDPITIIFREMPTVAADMNEVMVPPTVVSSPSASTMVTAMGFAPDAMIEFTVTVMEGSADDIMESVDGHALTLTATGSAVVEVTASDGTTTTAPVTVAFTQDELEAPSSVVVQDNPGDNGYYVMVSFANSSNHADVSQYRVYREMMVNTTLDADGNVVTTDTPMAKWVPWAVVDAISSDEDMTRAVVPVTDNTATRWGVAAESGSDSAEEVITPAGKRVFSKESVQLMAQILGVDPNRVVTEDELSKMFMPSADYIKSIIGDRKNVVFAALDPDVSVLIGGDVAVPQNIRTGYSSILTSPITATEDMVAAMDNMAPAAVTDVSADVETGMVTWTVSADDGGMDMVMYRGHAIVIPHVTGYIVMGGASEDAMLEIGVVPAGSTSFQVPQALIESLINQGLPAVLVTVVAMDGTNMTPSVPLLVELTPTRKAFVDADGGAVYIVKVDEAMTPLKVDFEDFVAFTMAFNTDETHENWRVFVQADLNDDKMVNFDDFILFFSSYGKEAQGPAGKSLIPPLGVNENAEFSLRLGSDRVVAGETMFVDVSLANVQALMGYGFVLHYDAEKFEFVEAVPAAEDLLKSAGGETPLFTASPGESGQVHVMNAIVNGSEVSGDGDIVRLMFRVLSDFEDNARFEIAEGLVFDPSQLANPLAGGVLDIQTTPTEFALLQNFPNPFNPDTTIGYELAESADVTLQIYNVVGQVVRTLMAAEPQSVGRYQVRWDGMDDRGTPVSSGIYFYQISAGKFQDVRKLMLLK